MNTLSRGILEYHMVEWKYETRSVRRYTCFVIYGASDKNCKSNRFLSDSNTRLKVLRKTQEHR